MRISDFGFACKLGPFEVQLSKRYKSDFDLYSTSKSKNVMYIQSASYSQMEVSQSIGRRYAALGSCSNANNGG